MEGCAAISKRYVLIDYENVQPQDLAPLDGQSAKVVVFLGANQTKIRADFAVALQARGCHGLYVRMSRSGRNVLDMHLASYVGEMATKEPSAQFRVISKDQGYDELVSIWKGKGVDVRRAVSLDALFVSQSERLAKVRAYLSGSENARPKGRKKLENAINNHLGKGLVEHEIREIVELLEREKLLSIDGEKVTYPSV